MADSRTSTTPPSPEQAIASVPGSVPLATPIQVSTTEVPAQPPPIVVGTSAEPLAAVRRADDPTGQTAAEQPVANRAKDPETPDAATTPTTPAAAAPEPVVWEGRYSFRNFLGRLIGRLVATAAWVGVSLWLARSPEEPIQAVRILSALLGLLVLAAWVTLVWQVFYGRLSHFYRLTTRRLFVWTGVFRRRLDQVELLEVNDVYLRQPTIWHRWFGVGTVVVESSEQRYPITYLVGVDDPQSTMDLIWRTARAERDGRSVRVDQV